MTREHAIDVFKSLAKSQGLYGRILRDMSSWNSGTFKEFDNAIKNFKTDLELIYFIEC